METGWPTRQTRQIVNRLARQITLVSMRGKTSLLTPTDQGSLLVMQSTLLPGGRLRVQYQSAPGRFIGLLMIAIGLGGWWYNWHLAATEGQFYIKLCLLGPLGLAGGILMLVRPEWAGPLRSDSTRAHKI